jgi:nucleoside-diphosphate-sugar epimerase
MAFSRFISAALDNREIHVYGDGGQIREFTFVDDVVRANLLVALSDVQSGSVFNVAGGSSTTVNEVLSMLEAIHDAPLTVRRQTVVPGDVSRTGGSFEALSAAVGWHPVISLADGLARQYESALLANRTRTR